jgi:hypothetical protein
VLALEGTVLASGARGDMDQLARLLDRDAVPHSSRHHQRLTTCELGLAIAICELEVHPDSSGDQKEQFVRIRVHFPGMRWFTSGPEQWCAYRVAVDAGRTAGAPVHEAGSPA